MHKAWKKVIMKVNIDAESSLFGRITGVSTEKESL